MFSQLEAFISERPCGQAHAPSICCVPSKSISGVLFAGFNVISFAGNHTLDAGVDAMGDTLVTLRSNGISVVGAGMNLEEARQPFIKECGAPRASAWHLHILRRNPPKHIRLRPNRTTVDYPASHSSTGKPVAFCVGG